MSAPADDAAIEALGAKIAQLKGMPTVAEEALAQLTEAATMLAKSVEEKKGLQANLDAAQQKIARLEQIIRGKSEKEIDLEEMTHQAGENGLMGLLEKQDAAKKVLEMQNTEVLHLGELEIVGEHLSETAGLRDQIAELAKAVRSIERQLAAGEATPSRETPVTGRTASLQLPSQEPTPPISRASRKRSGDGFAMMPPPKRQSVASRASTRQSASASEDGDLRSSSGLGMSLQGSARTGPKESSPWEIEDPREYPIAVLVPGQHGREDNILYDGAVPFELSNMLRSELQHHLNIESRTRVWNKLMPNEEKCVLFGCISRQDSSTWPVGHVASRA